LCSWTTQNNTKTNLDKKEKRPIHRSIFIMSHRQQYYGITVAKHVTQLLVFWLAFVVLQCQAEDVAGSVSSKPPAWVSNLHSFAAGGVGGVCSVLVGHPFDLVKVRMQTASAKDKKGSKGTFATLLDIVKTEGLGGLYRGVSAPLVAVAPIWAVSFWGFDTGDKIIRALAAVPAGQALSLPQLCFAGGFSALPTALVMVPAERIKCLLQIQQSEGGGGGKGGNTKIKKKQYKGFQDCASQIYKESGLRGLYKGTVLTLMRDVPGCMVYFGVYTIAKNALGESPVAALVSGALAGVSFWPVILPMDCLKSRYQTAPDGTYKNVGEVYTQLVQEEGVGGLFAGMGPAMIRSMPANAVSFLGAELTKSFLAGFM